MEHCWTISFLPAFLFIRFVHRLYITVIAVGVDLGKKGSNIPRQISQMSLTTFGLLTDIGPSCCWLEAGLVIAAINKVKYVTNGV